MVPLTLLSLVVIAVCAQANPIINVRNSDVTIPIAARLNLTGKRLPDIDRARASQHIANSKARASGRVSKRQASFPITNAATTYVANVGVGTPPSNFTLLIDTGSSNTWVGATKRFTPTSSTKEGLDPIEVTYGSGFFTGNFATDTVTLAPGLVIENQGIGVAAFSEGFTGLDGILGIGPVDLTEDTALLESTIPTVSDNLFSQGTIPEEVVTAFFAPITSATGEETNGALTFGSADTSEATSPITFTPITSASPANEFWGIDQSITFGTTGMELLGTTSGIVDTGTTLLMLSTDAFNTFTSVTGATTDEATGLLSISPADFANLQSLFFNIGGTTFELTPNAQLWPRNLNTAIGGNADDLLLVVADLGDAEGFDFINGFVFLERFLSVFDTTNSQVGFATTAHTLDETN